MVSTDIDGRLERIRPLARSYFDEDVCPAHDWHHVERVETNARQLLEQREETDIDVDETVLFLAVLLHDIGRPREDAELIADHAEWGASEARRILTDRDLFLESDIDSLESTTVDAVCHCIRAHRFSNDVEPKTLEARLLSDADNLDALGAIGLARTFSYGGESGTVIHDPSLPPGEDDSLAGATSVNHIHKKLLQLPDRMYTSAGRSLADSRCAFLETFLENLADDVSP